MQLAGPKMPVAADVELVIGGGTQLSRVLVNFRIDDVMRERVLVLVLDVCIFAYAKSFQ